MNSLTFLLTKARSSLYSSVWESLKFRVQPPFLTKLCWNIDFHHLAKYLPTSEFLFMERLSDRFMVEQLWQDMVNSYFLDSLQQV